MAPRVLEKLWLACSENIRSEIVGPGMALEEWVVEEVEVE
jgi:hypothetical protein